MTYKTKIAELSIGLAANQLFVRFGDYILYPFVIWKMGIVRGGLIMTAVSFLLCYLTFLFYDWSKKDWLGIETIKGIKDYRGENKIGKFTSWVLKKGNPIALFFLSIKFDPFIVTAYMRQGSHKYNGLSKRDWKIFIGSLLLGNAYWTLACYLGITLFEWGWKAIAG
jgi:hypothetical protein